MKKDTIYLGSNSFKEKELCGLIIAHLSKNDEKVKSNMIKYHMNEIRNVSKMLIRLLGGSAVEARTFNAYFYETVSSLGYTTAHLCSPYGKEQSLREGIKR